MADIENSQEEDEIRKSRVWTGRAMNGIWDGSGRWHHEDNKWNGNGKWEGAGGIIRGTWKVDGKWESTGDGIGDWNGDGELVCNIDFMQTMEKNVILVGFITSIVSILLDKLVLNFGWDTSIIIYSCIVALTILGIKYARSTSIGRLWLNGTWEDVGEFRILDISGKWKLGYHEGIISGKMKDHKPR